MEGLDNAPDLSDKRSRLNIIIGQSSTTDTTVRRNLYFEVCHLRREISFSNPLLDFDSVLFICGQANFGHIVGMGIGSYAVEALVVSDYAAVQGFMLAMAILFVLLNLAIDVIYTMIDPRTREG